MSAATLHTSFAGNAATTKQTPEALALVCLRNTEVHQTHIQLPPVPPKLDLCA